MTSTKKTKTKKKEEKNMLAYVQTFEHNAS